MAENLQQLSTDTTNQSLDTLRSDLLRPLPRISLRLILIFIVIALVILWGLDGTQIRGTDIGRSAANVLDFVSRLFPPQFELTHRTSTIAGQTIEYQFPVIVDAILETVQMALIGTLGAIFLSIPFGLLAARNVSPSPIIYQGVRLILNLIRAIPEIIWALIFVSAIGLGPFPGVMALAVGSIGSLSKVYAESIEAIDPQQVAALRATGAAPLQIFNYAVIPQAFPVIASYSLLLFEHNIRAATILGIVGAGGVGFIMQKYISLFQFPRLMGTVIVLVAVVTVIDRFSNAVRKRII